MGTEELETLDLNLEGELQTFSLNEHYKYIDIKEEFDSSLLYMISIKEKLGSVYTISDVISTPEGNFIEDYKLTDKEYNDLFDKGLDKHIDYVEG